MLWSSVSKAFDKSRYTLMGVVPLSKCCVILSITSNAARSVECFTLFPICRPHPINCYSIVCLRFAYK